MILATKEYKTVVADPPWLPTLGANWSTETTGRARPQWLYPTLSLSEICKIKPRLAQQAHIYIWCLAQHADWGYEVAREWGAEPIILLTWKKPGLGTGRFQCNTEHILVARKGNRIGNPFGGGGRHSAATNGTLFEWPRGRHSEKPEGFYDLVERISPPPYLDMFARRTRLGWDVWGNEVPQTDVV